jgi:hypothetical protein
VNGKSVRVPYGAAELAELVADGASTRP